LKSLLYHRHRTFFIGQLGVVLLSLVLYEVVLRVADRQSLLAYEGPAKGVTSMLARLVATGVQFDDWSTVEQDLKAAARDTGFLYAAVRGADGRVKAKTGDSAVADRQDLFGNGPTSFLQGNVLHIAVPLPADKQALGWLEAGFSLQSVREVARHTSLLLAVVTLVLGSITVLLIYRGQLQRNKLLEQIALTAKELRSASEQIQSACADQAAGSSQQASAVEETSRTMQALVEAAKAIADSSHEVRSNAENTLETTGAISQAIKSLTEHAELIGDISEKIRSISDKSDLVALNASLEGTRAGEAGRGFILVANEMRRLAESVSEAAQEIKVLSGNMRMASQSSVSAVEQGRGLATKTTDSVRQISMVTEQQVHATEQVTKSMAEVRTLLVRASDGVSQTESSAKMLFTLADKLSQLTTTFTRRGSSAGALRS
jgi:hypothetical protein